LFWSAAKFSGRYGLYRWRDMSKRTLSYQPLLFVTPPPQTTTRGSQYTYKNTQQGQCKNGSVGKEIKSWIDEHLTLVIGLAAGLGGLLLICTVGCCWRSYRRRSKLSKYAAVAAATPSARRRGGHRGQANGDPNASGGPLIGGGPPGMQQHSSQARGGQGVPPPPPLSHRGTVRYA